MTIPDDFVFSQHSLQDFADCPRRFQLRYLEKVNWPAPLTEPILEQEKRIMLGASFHRCVQQHLCGISAEQIALQIDDRMLESWWNNFLKFQPHIPNNEKWVEHTLSIRLGAYRCIARFDLILRNDQENFIIDWKTSERIPKREKIERKIQTILYPYLLCKVCHLSDLTVIEPDNLNMKYWYVNYPDTPVTIKYSKVNFAEGENYLLDLIEEVCARSANSFELTMNLNECKFCNYRSLCDRGIKAGNLDELDDDEPIPETMDLDIDQIGEIAL